MRDGITLMKTNFTKKETKRYRVFLFEAYGGPDLTWKAVIQEKNILNGEAQGKSFYWIKYK